MVNTRFWYEKLFHYMTQHEGGHHIDFREMSISPSQTTAHNCKTGASDDYNIDIAVLSVRLSVTFRYRYHNENGRRYKIAP